MSNDSRRKFLTAAAAGIASMPTFAEAIGRALAIPANSKTKSIRDLEHIVILMQENRSFDSYFGTLPGVRGYNDPRAITLPSGKPVWYQPNGNSYTLPYHFDIRNTNALRVSLNHSWKDTEAIWKDWNVWVEKKKPYCLGYFNRADLPYYYALADAFTVCDAYHCSVFGPTDPNRFYALSGHAPGNIEGLSDGNLYNTNNPDIFNADINNDNLAAKGIKWKTYAEILESNAVSWKVYQEWDNYGDNYLQYFHNFRVDANGKRLTSASPLYQKARAMAPGSTAANAKGTTGQWLIDQFAQDVKNNTLPAISWICAPTEYCEHPEATPKAGENFSARLLSALVDNPDMWSKTALIITYDENDGFFDHMPPYIPPLNNDRGRSTLSNVLQGEVHNGESIGLGPRVPLLVISPWSKGGRVCSELYDHTSLIRFMEEWLVQAKGLNRAAVQCPFISPWRRAVCGDMTRAFNFTATNTDWVSSIPRTATYNKNWGSASAEPPAIQTLPSQEKVSTALPRPAAALPYRSVVEASVAASANQLALSFANEGSIAVPYRVYSSLRNDGPWHYMVEAKKRIDNEVFNWSGTSYHLAVHSLNGFLREFRGRFNAGTRGAEVSISEDAASRSVRITVKNNSQQACRFKLMDLAYGDRTVYNFDTQPGESKTQIRALDNSQGWYDFSISIDGDADYWRHYAGHLEGAGLDFTDPVLNGLANVSPNPVPGEVSLSCPVTQIRVNESVSVSWKNLKINPKNWIGVYAKAAVPGSTSSKKWSYVTTAEGSVSFSGLAAGSYFIGLFLNDGYTEATTRLTLNVLP
ncbi:phosphocholine-specific phospholipase C [Undibacterium curvum]|uniref:phosphocholine-specific phospholipase C n=1 Tax=Undibacterium curvum TaxID=2762294 RepID=UPI003D10FF6D